MNERLIAPLLALVLFVLAPAPAAAARQRGPAAAAGWSAVEALAPGEKLVVRTKDGDRIAGRFVSATDILLVIRHDETDMSFARDNVRRVQLNRGKSRGKGALFGAAVGAGVGLALGSGLYLASRGELIGAVVPGAAVLGAGIGAGFGTALAKGNKNVTIYEAP